MRRTGIRRLSLLVSAGVAATVVLLPAAPASAHPLGNFSVNQFLGLTLYPDRVDGRVAVDYAEIPTLQERPAVDADGNGTVSEGEASAYARSTCTQFGSAVDARTGGDRLMWTVTASTFGYTSGTGGLDVSRLTCGLTTPAALAGETELSITNGYLADRVGWREMTASGAGVGLVDSPLPTTSVSDELRNYPQDLLASALDIRSARLTVTAGAGTPGAAGTLGRGGDDPISRWMATVDRTFQDLAGGPLTPTVGMLAVLLAIVLGAGHAALPGHGKTVLAAYLAGKRGRPRDALTVAGTVTLTHTGGVLALGLLLTAGTALAGERILGWLGLVSGVVVLTVGGAMLLTIVRRQRHARSEVGESGGPSGGRSTPEPPIFNAGHHHHHDPSGHHHDHGHTHDQGSHGHGWHDHGGAGHHDHGGAGHHDHGGGKRSGKLGLAGIGVAGGLVPSPSALVVLLAAIGLGRTAFGIVLVVAYGIGMAATLTGAGLLLLVLQRRLARSGAAGTGRTPITRRLAGVAAWLHSATPAATAALVFVVGAGLAARAAATVL